MNTSLISLELFVVILGLALLLVDLWTPANLKRRLGYVAAVALGVLFVFSFQFATVDSATGDPLVRYAFLNSYVMDSLAIYFKRFFLLAAIAVLLLQVAYADRLRGGISEYYSLTVMALAGMMFSASANNFAVMFVSLELITITFYVLTSFRRHRLVSLEAGIKYLVFGALSSGVLIYGIALVYGVTGSFDFGELRNQSQPLLSSPLGLIGLLLVYVGVGFKLAVFPAQVWAPDVYQGSPTPTTAFLAVGSKAAGVVLLLRLTYGVFPEVTADWIMLFAAIAAISILYGNLCALPQRNLKRLFGYSSIAHGGYLLLGVVALNQAGATGVLYYLAGYLFTVIAAFTVIVVVLQNVEGEDVSELAGLSSRSPLLAGAMTLAMASLAGLPPLAGFFGKFLLFKAVLERAETQHALYWLVGIAIVGVVISIWYYFGIVRAMFWSKAARDDAPIIVSAPLKGVLWICIGGMLYLGIYPKTVMIWAENASVAIVGF